MNFSPSALTSIAVDELCRQLNQQRPELAAICLSHPKQSVKGVCSIEQPQQNALIFATRADHLTRLFDLSGAQSAHTQSIPEKNSKGWPTALVITPELAAGLSVDNMAQIAVITSPYPALFFAATSARFSPPAPFIESSGESNAPFIHPTAKIGRNCSIGAFCSIGPAVELADDCIIGAHCVIGQGARIGAQSVLHARVTVYPDCQIGQRALILSGAVIGSDGFGFVPHQGTWQRQPHLGIVRIGNDVEIGANTTIDRATLDATVIEDGVKIDNQVHIAHNCHIGEHTAIAGCCGIAGSTIIGKRCQIGGSAMIQTHLRVADDTVISSGSFVASDIPTPGRYTGIYPLQTHREWQLNASLLRHLSNWRSRLKRLETHWRQD